MSGPVPGLPGQYGAECPPASRLRAFATIRHAMRSSEVVTTMQLAAEFSSLKSQEGASEAVKSDLLA